jgi:hypothetical protein
MADMNAAPKNVITWIPVLIVPVVAMTLVSGFLN